MTQVRCLGCHQLSTNAEVEPTELRPHKVTRQCVHRKQVPEKAPHTLAC